MKYTGFLLLFWALFLGCDENLDIDPVISLTPEVVLQEPENLRRLLLGAYAYAGSRMAGQVQSENELFANEGDIIWLGPDLHISQFNSRNFASTNFEILGNWATPYRSINLCNIVLDNLEIVESQSERAMLEGEARFLKGLQYFELVRIYALPYNPGGSNAQLGVPIVMNGVTDASQITFPSRNSVEEVYQLVVEDLEKAYAILPEDNGIFADRFGSLGLLARVYLQMGEYNMALDAAHEVISGSGHTLAPDINGAFNNDNEGPEDLFMWQVTTQDGFNGFNGLWAPPAFGGNSPRVNISIDSSFFELFPGTDDRAGFFYQEDGLLATAKWQSHFANVPYMRLAEMYLIRAECNFRLGMATGADPEADINLIRERANAEPILGITLNDILDERRRELAFEGHTLHDAKRLKQNIHGLPYDDDKLVYPLPQSELDANPNLEPNPGYSN